MPLPRTANEALAERVLSDTTVTGLIGNKFSPTIPDQAAENDLGDYAVYSRSGGGDGGSLEGRSGLQRYGYRIDVYGSTDEITDRILEAIVNRLCGNRKLGIAIWRDLSSGIHGCFPIDDADAGVTDDGERMNGQSVTLWFCPQA